MEYAESVLNNQSKPRVWQLSVGNIRFALFASIVAFVVLRSVHLVIRFQDLGALQVVTATLIFMAMVATWMLAAIRISGLPLERLTSPTTWAVTSGLTLFWWLASSPVNSVFTTVYAPEFPAHAVDAGEGVAADTFHHSSMIFSIMNFGYPSTGLDGTPLTPYHVLSHYVDAGILNLTGLTPLDSAGFLLQLKIMLFVAAILIFLSTQFRDMPTWFQLLAPVVLLPTFSANWHVVGSHGLWFTTLVVVVTAPFAFAQISTTNDPSSRSLAFLALLGVALSLGKISVGLIFMFLVGMLLWFRNRRDIRIYFLGAGWIAFISIYGTVLASDRTASAAEHVTLVDRGIAAARMVLLRDISVNAMVGIYALLTLLVVVMLVRPTAFHRRLVVVALAGTVAVVGTAALAMDPDDRFYFTQAHFFILLTYSTGLIAQFSNDTETLKLRRNGRLWPRRTLVAITMLATLGAVGARSDFSLVNPNVSVISASSSTAFTRANPPASSGTGLVGFSKSLHAFMDANGLTAQNTRLFLPRQVWQEIKVNTSVWSDGETLWPLPLMVYAETGIPLYKGVLASHKYYGFSAYGPGSITPTRAEFEAETRCTGIAIVEVTSWSPSKFKLACEANR